MQLFRNNVEKLFRRWFETKTLRIQGERSKGNCYPYTSNFASKCKITIANWTQIYLLVQLSAHIFQMPCFFLPSPARFRVARLQLKINYFLQKSQSDKKKLRNRKPLGIVVLCHFAKFVSLLRKIIPQKCNFSSFIVVGFSVIYVSSDQLQFRTIKISFQGCGCWS